MKAKRQALLLEMLEAGQIDSQQSAVELLRQKGIRATQATVSRDLDELGAVKVREASGVKYATMAQASQYGASLVQVLRDFVIHRQPSGNMIVLRTPPGHANVVAAALDRSHLEGVLGIVAGDDTLFLCVDERLGGATVLQMIEKLEREAGN